MNFKENIKEDLKKVFFNTDEFADEIVINDNKRINAIFLSKSEIKKDEYSTFSPCFVIDKEDLKDIKIDDKITFKDDSYYITEIVYTDTYTAKLFISKDSRYFI